MAKPSFLTSPIKAFKAMVAPKPVLTVVVPKPVAPVLNESDLMILRSYMKIVIQSSHEHAAFLKGSKCAFWTLSDVNRKDDPVVAENYKSYKIAATDLRNQKIRHKRFVQIQKKIRTLLRNKS